ncbi:putative fluoride ion transporter CrcB [Lentibacillus sp. JNUCC-1]|uniref:fluoride efflux transporter CrcB n=1 Tax=Lentibacillus sp. JNUCC-1 TaxID=2654513 RepID=UPI0012E74CDB|nr:fluoride efflux transporter CrcB [Lentibacillus sp. JNUCC-1]MUV36611.1 putative fluoride ion transporter CrcB [Lentibacillus sp. JNUCC-1]
MIMTGIGGAFGAVFRYTLASLINRNMEHRTFIPVGTWFVNAVGSFTLGALYSLHVNQVITDPLWFLLGVGFCGAFTTFSTFGHETITLLQLKKTYAAASYVAGSVIVCTLAAWLGMHIFA